MHWDAQRQRQMPQDRRRNWAGLVWFQTTNHGENIPCLKCTITITGRRRNCSKQMFLSWTRWLETRWWWWQSWKWSRGGWWARVCMKKTKLPHFWCITKRIERKQKNSFEISEQNATTYWSGKSKIKKFIEIIILLLFVSLLKIQIFCDEQSTDRTGEVGFFILILNFPSLFHLPYFYNKIQRLF